MRVLFTIHDFLPKARAGSELYTLELAAALQRDGHDVHVFHGERADSFEIERREYAGIACTVVKKQEPIYSHDRLPNEVDPRVERAFDQLLDEWRPDVVHVNHLLGLSTNLPLLARARGIPVVFTVHDFWLDCLKIIAQKPDESLCHESGPAECARCCRNRYASFPDWTNAERSPRRWKHRIKDALFRWFDQPDGERWFRARAERMARVVAATSRFIVPSRFLLDRMAAAGIPREKLVYCDNGMPDRLAENRPAKSSAESGKRLRFGFVGTLTEHKGVDLLLAAFDGFAEADLILYGRENRPLLDRFAHVLRQPHVQYRGVLTDEQKSAAFAEFDALVVPSVWWENSPLTIHEAFLAGVPVVTSNIGGMAELVPDGVCGAQFEVGDVGDLRAKLTAIVRDPGRLEVYRRQIPRVKLMSEHVGEILNLYRLAASEAALSSGDAVPTASAAAVLT
jgi:glycosyltransferase involved in cell wall biosynthesis